MPIFTVIFPVVAVAGLGYLSRAFRVFSEAETNAIERIAFWFLLPCLLFYGTATADFPAQMNWSYLGGFYAVLFSVYLLGMLLGRVLFAYSLRELSVFGMATTYSNVTVLGIPITLQLLGEAALVPMLLVITVHNLLLFTFGTILAELRMSGDRSMAADVLRIGKEMLLNPVSGSLLAGAAWNLLGLGFWAPLADTFELVRPAAIPGALFALGAGLHRYHIRGEISPAVVIVAVKLFVQPLLMWWVMSDLLDIEPLWAKTATMLAAMPVGISVYVFSRRFHCCETAAATSIVLACLGSVLSISLLVWFIGI